MGDLIDFGEGSAVAKLREELDQKTREADDLREQLAAAKSKISTLVGVKEMMKLQLNDIMTTLTMFQHQISGMIGNVGKVHQSLPDINTRLDGVRTQDRNQSDQGAFVLGEQKFQIDSVRDSRGNPVTFREIKPDRGDFTMLAKSGDATAEVKITVRSGN